MRGGSRRQAAAVRGDSLLSSDWKHMSRGAAHSLLTAEGSWTTWESRGRLVGRESGRQGQGGAPGSLMVGAHRLHLDILCRTLLNSG